MKTNTLFDLVHKVVTFFGEPDNTLPAEELSPNRENHKMISGQQQSTSESTPGANTPPLSPPEDWKHESQFDEQWEQQREEQPSRLGGQIDNSQKSSPTAVPTDERQEENATLSDFDWAASSAALWMDAKERHEKRNEQEQKEAWEGEQQEDMPLEVCVRFSSPSGHS